mmetsp:Transcript_34784/g.88111  ORF Transcript_34784/g.88111 Transcript_34784/m.88111 type:complete len:293 (-) Transcript_34784:833-1711(-)
MQTSPVAVYFFLASPSGFLALASGSATRQWPGTSTPPVRHDPTRKPTPEPCVAACSASKSRGWPTPRPCHVCCPPSSTTSSACTRSCVSGSRMSGSGGGTSAGSSSSLSVVVPSGSSVLASMTPMGCSGVQGLGGAECSVRFTTRPLSISAVSHLLPAPGFSVITGWGGPAGTGGAPLGGGVAGLLGSLGGGVPGGSGTCSCAAMVKGVGRGVPRVLVSTGGGSSGGAPPLGGGFLAVRALMSSAVSSQDRLSLVGSCVGWPSRKMPSYTMPAAGRCRRPSPLNSPSCQHPA